MSLLSRRRALQTLFGGTVSATALGLDFPFSVKFRSAHAQSAGLRQATIVKVFQRGGADGLYLVPPYGEPNQRYYDLRPTCHIDPPNQQDPDAALDLDGFFGLNPNLAPLMEPWSEGNLAVMPATHYDNSSRSHFDSQRWIEQGVIGPGGSGYFNRFLGSTSSSSTFRAMTAGEGRVTDSLKGPTPYPSIGSVNNFSLTSNLWCPNGTNNCAENELLERLADMYASSSQNSIATQDLVAAGGADMVNKLELFANLDDDYQPAAGGLDYTNNALGRGLRLAAQLIKADAGVEVIATTWRGAWDSHNDQRPPGTSPSQSNNGLHRALREAVNFLTFYRDLADAGKLNDVVLIVGTEFGRTSRQNGSNGTDHGRAAAWFAMGGRVNGGVYGAWPGLAENQLDRGRYLDYSVNYKDILGEAMVDVLGASENAVFGGQNSAFPNHTPTDLGIFSA